jgi:UDP-N-acetylmuramoyl-L-alanyl-D-glutamate--2,6-diaminopimelate ligase
MPVRLSQLLQALSGLEIKSALRNDVLISGIQLDSRHVKDGNLFVALIGENSDGHRFIPDAIRRGAAAVVGTSALEGLDVPYIQVSDDRLALAMLSSAFYGFPARSMTVIGVTGTDGKTTTCNLLYRILLAAGKRAGMVSTVNAVIGDEVIDTGFHVTTPESPDIQHYLVMMRDSGLDTVILETTSHGLAQHRVDGCEYDIGVVTNITHEHLDYHGSLDAYRAAKARLFTGLAKTVEKARGNPRLAVLNRDDSSYDYLSGLTTVRKVSYGVHPEADVRAEKIQFSPSGLQFMAVGPAFRVPVKLRLIGQFNISNALAALTTAVIGLKIDPITAATGLESLEAVPGRMERIDMGQDFTAIVDFAHTPNALQNALETIHQVTQGRILAVFGSAGLRDREKRRLMAAVSMKHADVTILTAEDPRTEDLDDILAEMTDEAIRNGGHEGKNLFRVPDRGEAIRTAVQMAEPGDVVISCGKGHEQSMCFGTIEYAWDDRTALRAALAEFLGVAGPQMPYLPTSVDKKS